MQLKNNLKVNKEVITNLMEKQNSKSQLNVDGEKDSFRDHSILLTENFDYNMVSSKREKAQQ